jgi:hypothetical protein
VNRPAQIVVATVVLLTLGSVGCARWKQKPMALTSVACMYDRAELMYHVDASRLGLPLALSKVEAQHVSYQESPSSPQAGTSTGTLRVRYPHPQAGAEMALAEVVIDSRAAGGRASDTVHEVWTLDIPKNDLDQIVGRLRETNFFVAPGKSQTGVTLMTSLDKVSMNKDWDQVPELNLLMQQVRSHGQLVAYSRPVAGLSAGSGPQPSSSRIARFFGKSKAPVQAANYTAPAPAYTVPAYAAPAPTQAIKYDAPTTSLPNPIYSGIGGQTAPALPYGYGPPAVQAQPVAQPALPGVSVSGANAVYGGPSEKKPLSAASAPGNGGVMPQGSGGMGGGGMGGGGMQGGGAGGGF